MSWVPPFLANPACARCSHRQPFGILVGEEVLDFSSCWLIDEPRFWFRKNPPLPNLKDGGKNCKRYDPQQAAGCKLEFDWIEWPPADRIKSKRETQYLAKMKRAEAQQ